MSKNFSKPHPSAYSLAYSVLLEAYENAGKRPLSMEEAEHHLKVTPGVMFADGVTLNDVLQTLRAWQLIQFDRNQQIEALAWSR